MSSRYATRDKPRVTGWITVLMIASLTKGLEGHQALLEGLHIPVAEYHGAVKQIGIGKGRVGLTLNGQSQLHAVRLQFFDHQVVAVAERVGIKTRSFPQVFGQSIIGDRDLLAYPALILATALSGLPYSQIAMGL